MDMERWEVRSVCSGLVAIVYFLMEESPFISSNGTSIKSTYFTLLDNITTLVIALLQLHLSHTKMKCVQLSLVVSTGLSNFSHHRFY